MNLRISGVAVVLSLFAFACSGGSPDSSGGGSTPTGGGGTDTPTPGGSSTGTPTPAPTSSTPPTTVSSNDTWADGKSISSSIDIAAGATITIAPGAKITVASGVTITVHGTLTADAKTNHASLSGSGWSGIVVASGGTLTLSGVDLSGAGIETNAGDAKASYDYGTINGGAFTVDKDSALTTDHAAFVNGGSSTVKGTFTATFLDYAGADIMLTDVTANVSVADSKFTASGGDFFISSAGAMLHAEYSVITGSHCPFHVDSLEKYTFDHVATRNNQYGLMLYNTDQTKNTISYSSFEDPNFDQTGTANEVDIDHTYIKSKNTVGIVKITTAANSPVTAAAPRGTPGPG